MRVCFWSQSQAGQNEHQLAQHSLCCVALVCWGEVFCSYSVLILYSSSIRHPEIQVCICILTPSALNLVSPNHLLPVLQYSPGPTSVYIATVSPAEVQAAVPVAFVDSAGGVPGVLLVFHQQTNDIAVFPSHNTRVHWDISTYWFCQ